jgi:PIN domain nuclease of toxin-antitoxin system
VARIKRVLLDTHALIWALGSGQTKRLSVKVKRALEEPDIEVFVSSMSIWEMGIKYRLGKLSDAEYILGDIENHLLTANFLELPFTPAHGIEAASIQVLHGDPFDRAIAAQAKVEKLYLASADEMFQGVPGLNVLW